MSDEKLILVTNDDGYDSKGIRALAEVAVNYGRVVVLAPSKQQSAKGHSITLGKPLRLKKVNDFDDIGVEAAYSCSGLPVDCVKIAVGHILDRQPDLCLSGINHGSNSATNIVYSGTMAAATEAALSDIYSIGFSLMNFDPDCNMEEAKKTVDWVLQRVIKEKDQKAKLLNVNIPDISFDKIRGVKVCRQGNAKWKEAFVERVDPFGHKYYWLTGFFEHKGGHEESDIHALQQGYVSIVPAVIDRTHYDDLNTLRNNWTGLS